MTDRRLDERMSPITEIIAAAIFIRVVENLEIGMERERAHREATIEVEEWWVEEKKRRAARFGLWSAANMKIARRYRVYAA